MDQRLKIGILREGKTPPDARTPLTPEQCAAVQAAFPVHITVQSSPVRAFSDAEYAAAGIAVTEDVSHCEVLLGVKEVPVENLIAEKTYFFFSHTIKKQPYNRKLLQAVVNRGIRLIDYEVLTNEQGNRLVAFGFYAGVVGAHNGMWTYGARTGAFSLPRMYQCHDYAEVKQSYGAAHFPPVRIVLTGGGRVAAGAIKNLHHMGIPQVAPVDFLKKTYPHPVFTQLFAHDYVQHRSGPRIFDKQHFYSHGEEYISTFTPYWQQSDLFINGIFYDKNSPAFFTVEDMKKPDFRIQVIADITCDIAPDASVPSTLRASTIADPVYGYDPHRHVETPPFQPPAIDVMAIDNLPSELPRDASAFFGQQLIDWIFPEFAKMDSSEVLHRGTIAAQGKLNEPFLYLTDYVLESTYS